MDLIDVVPKRDLDALTRQGFLQSGKLPGRSGHDAEKSGTQKQRPGLAGAQRTFEQQHQEG
jgi:hypothetical protein